MFITRLPLGWLHPKREVAISLGETAIFFPLWGAVIAGIAMILVWPLFWLGVSWPVVALILLGLGIILSGALHEDGLADCCDGFWGGQIPEDRYRIMKDSAIGSYGTIGLIFSIALRWLGLMQFDVFHGMVLFLLMHTVPRGFLGVLWAVFPSREGAGLATQKPTLGQGGIALLLVTVAVFIGVPFGGATIILATVHLSMLALCLLAWRKLGGLNGDCFGGAEQCGQIALCLVFPTLAFGPYLDWS